jgi:hypothetical protein
MWSVVCWEDGGFAVNALVDFAARRKTVLVYLFCERSECVYVGEEEGEVIRHCKGTACALDVLADPMDEGVED